MRKLLGTFFGCLVVGYFTAMPFGGFMLLFVLPFLLAFLIRGAYRARKQPETRRLFYTKVTIWCLLLCVVSALHLYYYSASRAAANEVAHAVEAFKAKNGDFPKDLSEAGIVRAGRGPIWRAAYFNEKGRVDLFYPATFIVFDTYRYDFAEHKWVFRPD
jgi:hypothetical protein